MKETEKHMKINGLYPGGFGKLKDREIRFDDGINIIYGQNEAGKSTLRNFLTAMLFGWEKGRAKADPYKKYRPWDAAGIYGGAMDLTHEGREYRVERDFTEGGRSLRVYLQPSMREIPAEGGLMEAIGSRVTRAGFENTAMVPQGSAAPGDELSELYGNYIANLALSKDREVDVPAALAELSEQRKALEKKKLPEKAAELRRKIGELETLMAELDRTAAAAERLRAEKATIEGKLTELSEDRSLAEEQQLAEYLREYDVYCEELERRDRLAEEIVQTERKQTELLDGIPDVEELEQTEKRVDSLLRELVQAKTEWKSEREKFAQQETELRGRKRRKALLWIPGLVLFAAAAGLLIASLVKKTEKLASLRPYTLSALVIGGGLAVAGWCARAVVRGKLRRLAPRRKLLSAERSERQAEIEAALAELPTEEELHTARDRAVADTARAEECGRRCAELCERMTDVDAGIAAMRDRTLAHFSTLEPAEEISDTVVSQIRGHVLARSVQCRNRRSALATEKEELTGAIARMAQQIEDGEARTAELYDARQKLSECEAELAKDERKIRALALAEETIRRISTEIHDSFGRELRDAISEFSSKTTAGAYAKVSADEGLAMRTSGGSKAVETTQLSAGTAEQTFLALRLAVLSKMYGGEHLPLVFDDSFVYYDTVRLRSTLQMLSELGTQILLFTCRDTERELLGELGIPHRVISL